MLAALGAFGAHIRTGQDEEVGARQGGRDAHEGEGGCGGGRHVYWRVREERNKGSQRPCFLLQVREPAMQSRSTRWAWWGWVPAEHSGDSSGKATAGAAHLPWGLGPVIHNGSSTPSAQVLLSRTDSSQSPGASRGCRFQAGVRRMQDKLVPFQWLECSARGSEFCRVLPLIELESLPLVS